jgi:uncharacterized membrane protein YeaQ/YmgE (transglycosylase-associated protein family)
MGEGGVMEIVQQAMHDLLLWVGFGTLVGLTAKAIMPGRDPGGAVTTLLMGIAGSVIGCGVLSYFWEAAAVTPISPIGFGVATAGAFILLGFYRLFAGSFHLEAQDGWAKNRRREGFGARREIVLKKRRRRVEVVETDE